MLGGLRRGLLFIGPSARWRHDCWRSRCARPFARSASRRSGIGQSPAQQGARSRPCLVAGAGSAPALGHDRDDVGIVWRIRQWKSFAIHSTGGSVKRRLRQRSVQERIVPVITIVQAHNVATLTAFCSAEEALLVTLRRTAGRTAPPLTIERPGEPASLTLYGTAFAVVVRSCRGSPRDATHCRQESYRG